MISVIHIRGVRLSPAQAEATIREKFQGSEVDTWLDRFLEECWKDFDNEEYVLGGHHSSCECGCRDRTQAERHRELEEKAHESYLHALECLPKDHLWGPLDHDICCFVGEDGDCFIGTWREHEVPPFRFKDDEENDRMFSLQKLHDDGFHIHEPELVDEDQDAVLRDFAVRLYINRNALKPLADDTVRDLFGSTNVTDHLVLQ